jgi:DNA mismatch repair protein MutL
MPSIKVLPDNLINKIAAGEVVERPASVVKELIENSLDAEATEILVDVDQAGKRMIRVTDNGSGMSPEDARLAFERHATSKISEEADLDAIGTMGFRGEALASIASVAQVRLTTARRGPDEGFRIEISGGSVKTAGGAPAAPGTVIEVDHLFFNTPARLKFLKSGNTELSHIIAAVSHQALAHPPVRFRLTHNTKVLLDLPSAESLRDRAFQIFGGDLSGNLLEFSGERQPVRVFGLLGGPNYSRGDRTYQEFYVNGRYIKNASLTHALYEAYRDLVMRDRHPVGFVFLTIDPGMVDVNVHPAKAEVRFRNQSQVHDLVRDVIRESLRGSGKTMVEERTDRVREAVQDYGTGSGTPSFFAHADRYAPIRTSDFARSGAERPSIPSSSSLAMSLSDLPVPLAQVHDSFIVAQDNDGMVLIDQHAAHERVLFEKLQDQYESGAIPVQGLLIPIQVEPGQGESVLLKDRLEDLRMLGFLVEDFGGGVFMIKGVPAVMAGGDHKRLLLDLLDEIRVHGSSTQMTRLRDDLLSVMACHPAIKVHRKLGREEMEGLIRDLLSCRMPHSCPHGRPTIVRFSMDEIKRMFKRM